MTDPIITLQAARQHLRLEDDYPGEQLQVYIDAGITAAEGFLNRRVFFDSQARTNAIADLPALLVQAAAERDAAYAAADLVGDTESRCAARKDADLNMFAALSAATEVRRGLLVNAAVRAAILLIVGHLFANREDVASDDLAEIPTGCRTLLMPYRVGLGV